MRSMLELCCVQLELNSHVDAPRLQAPAEPGAPPPPKAFKGPVSPVPGPPLPTKKGNLQHLCGCANTAFDFTPKLEGVQKIRDTCAPRHRHRTPALPYIYACLNARQQQPVPLANMDRNSNKESTQRCRLSNRFAIGGAFKLSTKTWSDHIWSFGQFLDHDLVSTSNNDDDGAPVFPVTMKAGQRVAKNPMKLFRLRVDHEAGKPKCRSPWTTNTPQIDGGMIYGHDADYLKARRLLAAFPLCAWPLMRAGSRQPLCL
jgi:Animal haem peroxidase